MGGTGEGGGEPVGPECDERAGRPLNLRRRSFGGLRRFGRVMMDANVTGSAAMVAYNILLGVIPVALLALFVGGQILSSHSVQQSVLEILKLRVDDLTAPELRAHIDELWAAFLRESTQEGVFPMRMPDGQVLQIEYSATANVEPGCHLSILMFPPSDRGDTAARVAAR